MCVRLCVRRVSELMLSGQSLVLGARPSSTSSSSPPGAPLTDTPEATSSPSAVLALGALAPTSSSSTPGAPLTDTPEATSSLSAVLALGALAPLFTPKRFLLEHGVSLKFLILGLMGCTQAVTGPFTEGEQLWWRRVSSFSGTRSLSSPAGENSRADDSLDCPHL